MAGTTWVPWTMEYAEVNAGEILPPHIILREGKRVAYCDDLSVALAIVDACNAAERRNNFYRNVMAEARQQHRDNPGGSLSGLMPNVDSE